MIQLAHTIALVACGGQSCRMGCDKGLITYHQIPQRYHIYQILSSFCTDVFLCLSSAQSTDVAPGYRFITDQQPYAGTGPMAALLSAADNHPGKSLLLIGTDYPFLKAKELERFASQCSGNKPVAFFNTGTTLYEPLLAWYPAASIHHIREQWLRASYSLQAFLREQDALKYIPEDKNSIRSIDDPMARDAAMKELQG